MKRKRVVSAAGVAIFLLLIMAFVLLPVVSAADLEIECHVTPTPGYHNKNFIYSVTITNNDIWRWDITSTLLRIYPSETATVYHPRRNSTTIQIPSGASKTVSFEVRLSDSNVYNELMRDSEYQEWLRNDRSSEWTQLWYNFTVEAKRGGSKKKLNCRGEGPILRKCLNVPDCEVTPIQGYVTDNFSYTVRIEKDENVNATLPDVRVTLYTYPNEDNDNDSCRYIKYIDMEDNAISVTFDNISVTCGCFIKGEYRKWLENSSDISPWTGSKYRFEVEWGGEVHDECEKFDQIIQKPIFNCYDPLKVNYNATKCNFISEISERGIMPFNFTAKVKIAERDDNVTLKVRNYTTSDEWDDKSFANYTSERRKNETLDWHANLSKHNLETIEIDSSRPPIYILTSSFSYTFYSPKIHRHCDYPEHLEDPNFIPHKRLGGTVESSVSPGEGTYNNTYTYNLPVKWPICDVFELQVRNYTKSDYWDIMGDLNYTTPNIDQSFTLPINLTSDHFSKERDGQYRFVSKVLNENFKFPGPIWTINLTQENITFSPKNGLYNSIFDFSLDVKANKNLTVKLFTICPNGEKKESEDYYTNAPEWQPLNWSVIPCENEATGTVEYWFEFWYWSLDLDTWIPVKRIPVDITETLPGPEVGIAEFKNVKVEPEIEMPEVEFTYRVTVNATKKGDMYLRVKDSINKTDEDFIGEYKKPNEERPYSHSRTFDDFKLGNITYWFIFKDIDGNKTPSEKYTGPELINESIKNLTVTPKKGTNSTSFTFCVDVNSTKEENVTLQVSSNKTKWVDAISKSYENVSEWKHICFPDIGIDSNLSSPQKENLTLEWNETGVIYWHVKGLVSNSNIIPTNWDINQKWHNWNFSNLLNIPDPKKGWRNDTFNFSVNLSADVDKGKVELLLNETKIGKNHSLGSRNYTNRGSPQLLNWSVNLGEFIEEYEGETEYEFVFRCGNAINYSGWLKGPYLYKQLNINFNNSHVEPEGGCIYSDSDALKYFEIDKIFNYRVNVWANKNTTVKLIVIDPYGNKLGFERKEYAAPEQEQSFSWNISSEELKIQSFETWNYTFNYTYYDPHEDKEINKTWIWENETDGEGPEIYAVLSNLSIDPEDIVSNGEIPYGDTFNVSCDVNGTRDLNITLLLIFDDKKEKLRTYKYMSPGKETKEWKNIDISKYGVSEFLLGLKVEEVI